jgi:uncharacterized damage-inducible protein DinB
MTVASLSRELAAEARTTRRQLERVPADKFDWRPHPKSSTAGMLASHLVECVRWGDKIFGMDELDLNPATLKPYLATSVEELLASFDAAVASASTALAAIDDEALHGLWRMKMNGKTRVERPRDDAFRDFTLSHMIHHRGQLSVYLRLLDVPVPGSYGPTADEKF